MALWNNGLAWRDRWHDKVPPSEPQIGRKRALCERDRRLGLDRTWRQMRERLRGPVRKGAHHRVIGPVYKWIRTRTPPGGDGAPRLAGSLGRGHRCAA